MASSKDQETDKQKARREEQLKRQMRDESLQKPFHFADRLNAQIQAKKSAVCVGLDPRLEQIPAFIKDQFFTEYQNPMTAAAESLLAFCKAIIDSTFDLVPVVKPQIAFFEQFGSEGIRVFEELLWYARDKGVLTIADIKRGDIGTTAEAYAKAYLGKVNVQGNEVFGFDADAVTVNPYMGFDSVKPFAAECRKHGKGMFVLAKTSNVSSSDVQDLEMKDSNSVYEIVSHYVESWGADDIGESDYSFIGAVVGATFPAQSKKLRTLMPNTIFLVPGYGAQGGTAKDVKNCFNKDGLGAVINASRSILFAWENSDNFGEKDFAEAARAAVVQMNKDIAEA